MDYYKVLGVSTRATKDEIKTSYRRLALKHHPDKHVLSSAALRDAAAANFRRVSDAYQTLVDDHKRKSYDIARKNSRSRCKKVSSPADASSTSRGRRRKNRSDDPLGNAIVLVEISKMLSDFATKLAEYSKVEELAELRMMLIGVFNLISKYIRLVSKFTKALKELDEFDKIVAEVNEVLKVISEGLERCCKQRRPS